MILFNKLKKEKNKVGSLAESIAEKLGFAHDVFPEGTDYQLLMREYQNAVVRGKSEGFTPVLVASDDILDETLEFAVNGGYSAAAVIEQGTDAKAGKAFLDQRFDEYFTKSGVPMEELVGDYDDEPERITGLSSAFGMTNKTREMILFEVPTVNPWEIAAYIPFGGWNECPTPKEMTDVLRYWFENYGAVPAAITHDTLELIVPSPAVVSDPLELAKEHCAFTVDRLYQGTGSGTLSEVAESLKVSSVWFFWWD